jgi:hypothetical protein
MEELTNFFEPPVCNTGSNVIGSVWLDVAEKFSLFPGERESSPASDSRISGD